MENCKSRTMLIYFETHYESETGLSSTSKTMLPVRPVWLSGVASGCSVTRVAMRRCFFFRYDSKLASGACSLACLKFRRSTCQYRNHSHIRTYDLGIQTGKFLFTGRLVRNQPENILKMFQKYYTLLNSQPRIMQF